MQRPGPESFAHYSYLLAFMSAGLVTIALIIGWLPGTLGVVLRPLQNLTWLALITSGLGIVLAYTARTEFRSGYEVNAELARRAKVGWRFNIAIFATLLAFAILMLVITLVL